MKLIVAGSRDFNGYNVIAKHIDAWWKEHDDGTELYIISGGAKGVDALGERYAEAHGVLFRVFQADWNQYGRSAGPRRNREMAGHADALLAFPVGPSWGTRNMIEQAESHGLSVTIIEGVT